jgi:hypothetical protein
MAALRVLAGATALMSIGSVAGLGARRAQPLEPSSGRPQRIYGHSSDDLIAAGKDADEDDDFDTWYF